MPSRRYPRLVVETPDTNWASTRATPRTAFRFTVKNAKITRIDTVFDAPRLRELGDVPPQLSGRLRALARLQRTGRLSAVNYRHTQGNDNRTFVLVLRAHMGPHGRRTASCVCPRMKPGSILRPAGYDRVVASSSEQSNTGAHEIVVDLADAATRAAGPYANFIITTVDDHVIRMSIMTEPFYWHRHPDSDETFLVVEGSVLLETARDRIELNRGQLYTVPAGLEHVTSPLRGRSVNITIEKAGMKTERVSAPRGAG